MGDTQTIILLNKKGCLISYAYYWPSEKEPVIICLILRSLFSNMAKKETGSSLRPEPANISGGDGGGSNSTRNNARLA